MTYKVLPLLVAVSTVPLFPPPAGVSLIGWPRESFLFSLRFHMSVCCCVHSQKWKQAVFFNVVPEVNDTIFCFCRVLSWSFRYPNASCGPIDSSRNVQDICSCRCKTQEWIILNWLWWISWFGSQLYKTDWVSLIADSSLSTFTVTASFEYLFG